MSNDLNQCNFIGRLGRDPEVKYTGTGDAVANFSIAVGETWKDKASGETKESTEWIRCVAWKQLGEICGEYLKKGSQVFVSGRMKTRKWQDKDGQDKYTTEIIVDRMQMLGGKPAGDRAESQERTAAPEKSGGRPTDDLIDDIPF